MILSVDIGCESNRVLLSCPPTLAPLATMTPPLPPLLSLTPQPSQIYLVLLLWVVVISATHRHTPKSWTVSVVEKLM